MKLKINLCLFIIFIFVNLIFSQENTSSDSITSPIRMNGFYFSTENNVSLAYQRLLSNKNAIKFRFNYDMSIYSIEDNKNSKYDYYQNDEYIRSVPIDNEGDADSFTMNCEIEYVFYPLVKKEYRIFIGVGPHFKYSYYKLEEDYTRTNNEGPIIGGTYIINEINTYGIGITGSIGIEFNLNDRIGVFANYQGIVEYFNEYRDDKQINYYNSTDNSKYIYDRSRDGVDIDLQSAQLGLFLYL